MERIASRKLKHQPQWSTSTLTSCPGLDDGAQSMEESVEMLAIAAASGTTDIVATPHANGEFRFEPERIQRLFQDLSGRKNVSIRIHLGCDFHLNYDNLLDAINDPAKYTIK